MLSFTNILNRQDVAKSIKEHVTNFDKLDENIDNNYPAIEDSGGAGGFDTSRSIRFSSTAKTFDAAA